MKFPSIGSLASTSISILGMTNSVADALEMMLIDEHRNMIVRDVDCYRVLSISDVLCIQNNAIDVKQPLSELNLPKIPMIDKDKNVLETMRFLNDSVEYICAVNSDGSLFGLVTHTDITHSINPETLMENYRLVDYLKSKHHLTWVNKDAVTSVVLKMMLKERLDNVIIVDGEIPIGILTPKDIIRLIKEKSSLELEVSVHMSTPVETINHTASIKEALGLIKKMHYKRVVVVDNMGALTGVITQKELISLTYERWSRIMYECQEELSEINNILQDENREYQRMASTDPLTGLYNRYRFSELYVSSQMMMLQQKSPLSLLLLDIDHFKQINDNHGHNVGDQALIAIAEVLLKTVRSTDIVCRWGGEEFIILLPNVDLTNASVLAEKVRNNIEELSIDVVGTVTTCVGVSEVRNTTSMHDVIDRADKALYLAKHSGRNCVKTEFDHSK